MTYFSIIIPVFNRASFLIHIINNLSGQYYQHFEIIIMDDGSTDHTKELAVQLTTDRIHYYYQENQGVCAARNNGARYAKGDFLIFLDSDDLVEKNWLQDFNDVIVAENPDLVCCGVNVNKSKLNPGKKSEIENISASKIYDGLLAGAFTIRRELFFDLGLYDEKMKFGENTELSIRIQTAGVSLGQTASYNLWYFPSSSGAGRNLLNRAESNVHILSKHKDWFSSHPRVKRLYLQTTAVAYFKLEKYSEARQYFFAAWKSDPYYFKSILRILLSYLPFIAKRIWKQEQL